MQAIKDDLSEFAQTFQIDTDQPSPIEAAWKDFKDRVLQTIDKNVPTKLTQARYSNPWIDTDIRRAIRRKQRAHAKAKETGKKKDRDRYRRLQLEVKDSIKKASRNYLNNIVTDDFKSNSKKFWAYVKSKRQESQGVSPLKSCVNNINT